MIWRCADVVRRLLPGGLASLLFAGLLKLGALQPFEQIAYNTLFTLRGEQAWDDRLVLVAIDDASLQKLGRFPWPRQHYVKLLQRLQQAESSIVMFDLVWSESSPEDGKLAQAIAQHGQVVLAQAQDSNGVPLLPVPELQKAAIATGHILRSQDTDGITRRLTLQVGDTPALGLAVVQSYSLVQAPVSLPPLDRPLSLNWVGRSRHLRQYSFAEVMAGRVPAAALRNKLILVGATAVGIDPMVSPFDRDPPSSGVHLQATLIHNLLQHNALQVFSGYELLLLLGGPGLSLLLSRWREPWQLLVWVGSCLGWGSLSLLLLGQGYWVPVALPIGLITTTTAAGIVAERLRVNAQLQQQVQQLWQRHQPDLVVANAHSVFPQEPSLLHPPSSSQSLSQLTALAEQFGRSQSTQAAIARSLSLGLLAADPDGRVWFCNPVAADWLQAKVGCSLQACLVPAWLIQTEWQAKVQALQQRQSVQPWELERGDRWIELKLEPLTYRIPIVEAAPLDGLLLLLEDITPRKLAEAALTQQVQELQRLSQLKDDFLSTVSHELRAPMTNIKMLIEVLKLGYAEQNRATYLKHLERECNREIELINDLLDLQRLEAGYQNCEPSSIELNHWLPMIVEVFQERATAQQQHLQVELPDLPTIVTDARSLQRVLVELLNNACKYTPPQASIAVTACCTPAEVQICVSNGCEIPAEELPRIFEKFYRVPQIDRWKRGGTGLGLALVQKLVESIGGSVQVSSGAGKTVFTVLLPLQFSPPQFPPQ